MAGIHLERIATTPVKSVTNSIKKEAPLLKQGISDSFEYSVKQLKNINAGEKPAKLVANTFKSAVQKASQAVKSFI